MSIGQAEQSYQQYLYSSFSLPQGVSRSPDYAHRYGTMDRITIPECPSGLI